MNRLTIAAAWLALGLVLLVPQSAGETPGGNGIARKAKSDILSSAVISNPASRGASMDKAAVHQEVDQLRKTWNAAWLENDSATVDKLMAPEYVYIAGNGQVLDRSAIMGVIRSPSYKIHNGAWTEVQINVLSDDAAVIIDRWTGTATLNGNTFKDDNRCSRFCLRRNGAWQIVFEQASAIPQ